MIRRWLFGLMAVFLTLKIQAQTHSPETETMLWDRTPIALALPVNQERRVDFPVAVEVHLPEALLDQLTLTLTPEGSVYWRAKTAFPLTRCLVADKSGRWQWLLDVSATDSAPVHPLAIADGRVSEASVTGENSSDAANGFYDEVDLMRMAAQQFYGPRRLAQALPGVQRVPISAMDITLYSGGELETVVKAAWRAPIAGGHLFVTVVQVANKTAQELRPDPRRLRGHLIAMAAQRHWLAPAGQVPNDVTHWYLVTDRSLAEALQP